MAKPKMKPLPRRPKKTASNAVKERWLQKAEEIKKENAALLKEYERGVKLDAQINGIISSKTHRAGSLTTVVQRYSRTATAKKKPTAKQTALFGARKKKAAKKTTKKASKRR